MPKKKKKRRKSFGRRKRSPETIFWTVLLTVMSLGGAGLLFYHAVFAGGFQLTRGFDLALPVFGEESSVREETEETATNVAKSDNPSWEPAEPDDYMSILLLGIDDHGMCDLVMVLTYDLYTFDASLISIKRDTYVAEQTWAVKELGQDHLSWANYRGMGSAEDYHAGAKLTAKTVEEMLGIELHAYGSITMEGFTALIDHIGGVQVNVPAGFAEREGRTIPTGLQRLDGEQALLFARHRQNPRIPEPDSTSEDGDRIRRNHQLIKAMFEQAEQMESEELLDTVNALDNKLYTSLDDWDILEMLNLVYHGDLDELETAVLPGEGKETYQERLEDYTYYFYLDHEETGRILRDFGLK